MTEKNLLRKIPFRFAVLAIIAGGLGFAMEPLAFAEKGGGGAAPDAISLSATSYDFGLTFVGDPLTRAVVTVTNTGNGTLVLRPTIAGDSSFEVVNGGCGKGLQKGSSCGVLVE